MGSFGAPFFCLYQFFCVGPMNLSGLSMRMNYRDLIRLQLGGVVMITTKPSYRYYLFWRMKELMFKPSLF